MSGWLGRRYVVNEWAYQRLSPMILVEELLEPALGEILIDWRFYVFGGRVKAVSVGAPIYRRRRENFFVTPEFYEIPLSVYQEAISSPLPIKPPSWKQLLETAEIIGDGIDFVRIDLYNTAKGIRFGEATVYPDGGVKNSPTGCPIFNMWFGQQWSMNAERCAQSSEIVSVSD